ncbi:PAS domain-containing protein, partial [Deinococcus pimensis]|uniref:PAS domain-containing protein n=1 Tax=Deinococcus pimensis TaxID=309888 RepID=UPI0005EB6AA9
MPRHSRALQAGRADTAFLDTLFEHATAAHAFYDADLRFVRVNDAFARLTGLPAEEHPGRTLAEVVPLIPPGLVQAYRRTLQTGVPLRGYEYVVPGHEPDGDIHRRADASVVRGAAGAVLGLVVTVEDVTEQVRALRARRRSEARTARLQVLTGALGGAVTPEQVREIVLREGSRAAGAYGAAIVTPEGEEDLLVMGASGYDGDTLERWRRLPAGGRLPVVQAMRTREAVFCTAADVARDFSDLTPHLQPQTLAVAALPLLAGDRLLGALTLSFADARDAAPEQRPFVRAVAEQCAQALDRARLFDEQRQAGERAALLARVGETLSESLDVRETLDRVASLAVRFVADWCAVYVPNEDFDRLPPQAQRLLPVAVAHDDPTRVEVLRALIERYPSDPSSPLSNEAVLRSGLPVLIERIPEDAVEQIPDPERREMVRALGLHSMLSVPLMAHGRRVGVLGMATSRPERTLTRDDLELAEEIARRAALALDNAQLYEVARRTGERYRSLVDATRQTVWTTDARGVLTGEQPGWSALTGQTRFDEGGEGWAQHVHPDDRERALQAWRRSVRERDVYEVELRMRVRGGDERHFHVRAVPITAPDGEIVEWVGVHTDVTERVEAERALRDLNATLEARVRERTRALEVSERRFRGIFDSQFQFIGLMRPDGVILEANRTALDFGGVTSEDVIGKFLWDSPWWATTEEARHDLRKAVARAALGETVRYDVDVRGAGGVTALIDFSLKPVTDERGDVVMIIPEGRVIDEERRTAALLAAVVSGAPLILYAVDADGTFLLHEGAALASVGLKPGAFVGRNMRELFRDQPDVARPLERALRGETFKSRGAYEGRTFESWYTPMLDARGGVSGMIGVTVDVSEREEAERRREEALERAEVLAALGDALQVASTPEEAA